MADSVDPHYHALSRRAEAASRVDGPKASAKRLQQQSQNAQKVRSPVLNCLARRPSASARRTKAAVRPRNGRHSAPKRSKGGARKKLRLDFSTFEIPSGTSQRTWRAAGRAFENGECDWKKAWHARRGKRAEFERGNAAADISQQASTRCGGRGEGESSRRTAEKKRIANPHGLRIRIWKGPDPRSAENGTAAVPTYTGSNKPRAAQVRCRRFKHAFSGAHSITACARHGMEDAMMA